METLLCIVILLYCVYLNFRIRENADDISELEVDTDILETIIAKNYVELTKSIKECKSSKLKVIEKPRRRSTKKRS